MYPIDTQDGLFHDGDGISELGTILPASWLNQIQQELIAVLSEAGITPEKANTNQVVNAIKLIISDNKAAFAGVADAAKKLYISRKIGGVTFDGAADIDLPGVNKLGNQNTTGNAATATRLQTARTINGVPFDGTQDINATPAGAVMYFAMNTAPVGWLKANGAAVPRTVYANLFAAIGTRFGAGNGKTTFNLPDLRGEFLRGWDDGRGVDTGRIFGDTQTDAIRNIVGQSEPLHTQTLGNSYDKNIGAFKSIRYTLPGGSINAGASNDMTIIGFDASLCVPTANENRPRNITLLACIKI
jgi:microcystin-dependent protein